jgi:hypothetical protein
MTRTAWAIAGIWVFFAVILAALLFGIRKIDREG